MFQYIKRETLSLVPGWGTYSSFREQNESGSLKGTLWAMITQVNGWALLKWAGSAGSGFWNGLGTIVQILLILQAIDVGTGILGSFILKRVDSDALFRGALRKVMTWALIYVGHIVTKPLNVHFDLGQALAAYFIVHEAISITENCQAAGLAVPPLLIQTLSKARKAFPEEKDTVTTTVTTTETISIPPAEKVVKAAKDAREAAAKTEAKRIGMYDGD